MLIEFQLRMQENCCICPVEAMSCVLKMAYWCVVVIKTIVSNVSTAAFLFNSYTCASPRALLGLLLHCHRYYCSYALSRPHLGLTL